MKQKSKKLLSLLLALTMIMSMLSVSAFAAETNPFTDVSSDDWYYDEVLYVYENDLMKGTSTTAFSPDVTVNRAMMVTILYRLEGEPAVSTSGTFTDVTTGQYYTDAVEWAVANEITNGYGNGLFGPNDQLTREQMATFYYRYAEYKGYDVSASADLSGYTDVGTVSAYALNAFEWTNANGLITGTTTTTLSPQGDATRVQLAVILYRYCHNVVDEVEEYTVTFEYNYGSKGTYKTVTVEDGETVDQPSNPTRSGYSFSGWYTKGSGGSRFNFDTEITADLTLYAHWSSNNNGGGGVHTHSYAYTANGDGTHSVTCSGCTSNFNDESCQLGEYISNDDGTHTATCLKCGYAKNGVCQYGEPIDSVYTCTTCGHSFSVDVSSEEGSASYKIAVGTTGYNDFSEAVEAAADGGNSIVLLADLELDTDESINTSVILNLNGHDLTGSLTLKSDTILASADAEGSSITATESGFSAIVIDGNVKLTIVGKVTVTGAENGEGINVPEGSSLELTGDTIIAIGNNGSDTGDGGHAGPGGSGIGSGGSAGRVGGIYIHDMESLTAKGFGSHGFGIGGNIDSELKIENTTIDYVSGGFVQKDFLEYTDYGSSEPEGGAAIGIGLNASNHNVILTNVTIEKAEGGSKCAAIGGQYWTDAHVTIDGCTLSEIIGGNASAAIGGGRTRRQEISIVIKNSSINAMGGQYGAGIGSGYDSHCGTDGVGSTNIEISGSTITAQGGQYASGIGTGYHTAALTGFITGSSITATNGGSREKYTQAQNIGYGVIDVSREAADLEVTFTVDGKVIENPLSIHVSTAEALKAALNNTSANVEIVLDNEIIIAETVILNKNVVFKGEPLIITATIENESGIVIEGDVKLTVNNDLTATGATGGDGICVPAGSSLELTGNGSVKAIGNAGAEVAPENNDGGTYGGSGIGNGDQNGIVGDIYIHDMVSLTAVGYGKQAFGIGGNMSSDMTITGTTIEYVRGGYARADFTSDYGKTGEDSAEGGAAIGFGIGGTGNLTLRLENVNVKAADGGWKSAAIGGNHWVSSTIYIVASDLKNLQGGGGAAAIGAGRMTNDMNVSISITNSSVEAIGGEGGAGIGGGYNSGNKTGSVVSITIMGTSTVEVTAKEGNLDYHSTGAEGVGVGGNDAYTTVSGNIESSVVVKATGDINSSITNEGLQEDAS